MLGRALVGAWRHAGGVVGCSILKARNVLEFTVFSRGLNRGFWLNIMGCCLDPEINKSPGECVLECK